MNELLKELIDILNKELKIYNELLKLSKDKTDIIIKGKVSELENIVKNEQTLILKLGGMENKREGIIEGIAGKLDISSMELNISELVKKIEPSKAFELKQYQANFTGLLSELKEINDLNSKLVKNSLEFIDFSINMMTESANTGNNYGINGQVNNGGKRNLFDMKL